MPGGRRFSVSCKRLHAMSVTGIARGEGRLVYLLVADKHLKYDQGWSRIAYIGKSKRGIDRIAESAAKRSKKIFSQRGVNGFEVRILTWSGGQRVASANKLENALLWVFIERFGARPICNAKGGRQVTDE